MIIVYVAHPIGGDVLRNVEMVKRRCGEIYRDQPNIIPLAPYVMALRFLDDSDPRDRDRGIEMNKEFFSRRCIDELWLFGPTISRGMWQEVEWARQFKIPVLTMNQRLLVELATKEIKQGDAVRVSCDGPGGGPVVARFVKYLPNNEGVCIKNKHYSGKRLLYHEIPWMDVARIAPVNVPWESGKNFELVK